MISRHLYAIVGLATILTAISLSSTRTRGGAAPSQTSNVLVVNSANQAVPTAAQGTTTVAGSVSVSNFPTSQGVTVNNFPATQTVAVSGTPTVNVGNAQGSPIPVRQDISNRTPFAQNLTFYIQDGEFGQELPVLTVPAGKQLEIHDITAVGNIPNTNNPQGVVRAGLQFPGNNYFLPMFQTGTVGNGQAEYYGALTGCSIVLTSGQELDAVLSRSVSVGLAGGQITVVGFLVDTP